MMNEIRIWHDHDGNHSNQHGNHGSTHSDQERTR